MSYRTLRKLVVWTIGLAGFSALLVMDIWHPEMMRGVRDTETGQRLPISGVSRIACAVVFTLCIILCVTGIILKVKDGEETEGFLKPKPAAPKAKRHRTQRLGL